MALETPTYIDTLNAANPASGDNVSEGDDHLRNLKTAIKATFPNVTGAISATHTELNYVDGVTSAIQTQLDAKLPQSLTVEAKTDNFNAAAGYHYILRTNSSKTATLPGSPTAGQTVWFTNHSGGNWTIGRNSLNIMGDSSDDTMATDRHYEYVYVDSTTGWARTRSS